MVSYRSTLVRYLQTNGPSTAAELPRKSNSPSLTAHERKEGVRRFDPSVGGPTAPVFYLEKEHAAEGVIREWVGANPNVLESASPRAFLHAVNSYGPKFSDVSKEVARDLYGEAAWNDVFGGSGGGEQPDPTETLAARLEDMDPSEVFGNDGGE